MITLLVILLAAVWFYAGYLLGRIHANRDRLRELNQGRQP